MKKVIGLIVFVVVLSSVLFLQPSRSYAQGQVTPLSTQSPEDSGLITFAMLDIQDEVMNGPYDSNYVRFSTPDFWRLQSGAKLRLNLETTIYTSRVSSGVAEKFSGALMEVSINGHPLQTILLRTGVQEVEINIPPSALIPNREDGRHSIHLFLDATIDCLYDHETAVIVRSSSGMMLPYAAVSPPLDLTLLPRPIYKLDSLLQKPLIVVVPDNSTVSELQAAMTVSASLGRMSDGLMPVSLVNVSALTDLQREEANLIAVGNRSGLSILDSVTFPADSSGMIIQPNDGIIRIGISPWNLENVILYVGGTEETGFIKAAQAFSSGALRVGINRSLSVISNVADAIRVQDVATDRTFAMLGYPNRTMSGVGYQSLDYSFMIPLGKVPGAESSLKLIYNHSATLDFNASGVVIFINDQPLSSIRFTTETATETTTLVVDIPGYYLASGTNTLSIRSEFVPASYCSILNDRGLWMTIHQESLLHIPLVDAEESFTPNTTDLGTYPSPFVNNPTLGDLAFVFSMEDPLSWNLGATIAANLGQYATGSIIEVYTADASDIPADVRDNANMIIVGRASQLPIIQEINESLPAPFEAGSDVAIEDGAQITYRLPSGIDLGYLEFIHAPWNSKRSVLAVLGSTSRGMEWAGNALVTPKLRGQIFGTYVVATEQKLYAVDTTLGLGTQNISATAMPGPHPTFIPDQPTPTYAYHQDWVATAIVVTSSVIGVFLMVLGFVSLRKKSTVRKSVKKVD